MIVSRTGCFQLVFNDCGFIFNECEHSRNLIFNDCEQEAPSVFKQSRFCFQAATFMLEYRYKAYEPGVKEKIVDMAINGGGIRDTSRVLGINKKTVINTLKKRERLSSS